MGSSPWIPDIMDGCWGAGWGATGCGGAGCCPPPGKPGWIVINGSSSSIVSSIGPSPLGVAPGTDPGPEIGRGPEGPVLSGTMMISSSCTVSSIGAAGSGSITISSSGSTTSGSTTGGGVSTGGSITTGGGSGGGMSPMMISIGASGTGSSGM